MIGVYKLCRRYRIKLHLTLSGRTDVQKQPVYYATMVKIRPNPSLSKAASHLKGKTKKTSSALWIPAFSSRVVGFLNAQKWGREKWTQSSAPIATLGHWRPERAAGKRGLEEDHRGIGKTPELKITPTLLQNHAPSHILWSDWPVGPACRTQTCIQTQNSEWMISLI